MSELYALHYSNVDERTRPTAVAVSEDIDKLKTLAEERHQKYHAEEEWTDKDGEVIEAYVPNPLDWSESSWRGEKGHWDASYGPYDDDWWQIYPIKVV